MWSLGSWRRWCRRWLWGQSNGFGWCKGFRRGRLRFCWFRSRSLLLALLLSTPKRQRDQPQEEEHKQQPHETCSGLNSRVGLQRHELIQIRLDRGLSVARFHCSSPPDYECPSVVGKRARLFKRGFAGLAARGNPCHTADVADLIVQYWPLLAALAAAGLFAGLVAGLFGIGGGAVIVPVLYFLFDALGFGETAMHVAVSTSLATIIATSARSVMAHNKEGAVDWAVIRAWSPWIMGGAAIGIVATGYISGRALTAIFGILAFLLAAQLFFGRPDWRLANDLPGGGVRAGLGGGIGALSALMGIGGGTFGVSLLTVYGRPIHQAVATAAGFGVAIGLPGAIAAMIVGQGREGLPPFSIGHVNLIAFALIASLTVTMAPIGARLAHSLDAVLLKRLFALLLVVVAIRMIWSVVAG